MADINKYHVQSGRALKENNNYINYADIMERYFEGLASAGTGVNVAGSSRDIPDIELPVNENITVCARAISGTATVSTVFKAKEEW